MAIWPAVLDDAQLKQKVRAQRSDVGLLRMWARPATRRARALRADLDRCPRPRRCKHARCWLWVLAALGVSC